MDESRAAEALCYPGKAIEVRGADGTAVATTVVSVRDGKLALGDRIPCDGVATATLLFLGERYVGNGHLMFGSDGESVLACARFRPVNARSAPRVRVSLNGTYYVRPPTLGLPMQVLDISVSGLAFQSIPGESPQLGDRFLCGFRIGDREVKGVGEFIDLGPELWRARFIKLGLSDEEAIASFVLGRQLSQRPHLPEREVRAVSSLDVEDRLRYPLLQRIMIDGSGLVCGVDGVTVRVPVPRTLPVDPHDLASLPDWLRLGDLADLQHAFEYHEISDDVADLIVLGCLGLTAAHEEIEIATLLQRFSQQGSPRQEEGVNSSGDRVSLRESCSIIADYVDEGGFVLDSTGERWVSVARSVGLELLVLMPQEEESSDVAGDAGTVGMLDYGGTAPDDRDPCDTDPDDTVFRGRDRQNGDHTHTSQEHTSMQSMRKASEPLGRRVDPVVFSQLIATQTGPIALRPRFELDRTRGLFAEVLSGYLGLANGRAYLLS